MCGGCFRWHTMKYQRVSRSGCSCCLPSLRYVTGLPCRQRRQHHRVLGQDGVLGLRWTMPPMKGSGLKWHQDTLSTGRAPDVDHICEHSVLGVTCCYADGKHLSQSWTCWVSDATADSIWQDGQDRLSECTLSRRKFPLGGHNKYHQHTA